VVPGGKSEIDINDANRNSLPRGAGGGKKSDVPTYLKYFAIFGDSLVLFFEKHVHGVFELLVPRKGQNKTR
jgi:hypothetical protein